MVVTAVVVGRPASEPPLSDVSVFQLPAVRRSYLGHDGSWRLASWARWNRLTRPLLEAVPVLMLWPCAMTLPLGPTILPQAQKMQ